MIKALKLFYFILPFVLSSFAPAATLMLPEREGPPGSLVQVPVVFEGTEEGIAGIEFVLQYDFAVLEFVRLDTIGFSDKFIFASKSKEGSIAVSMARSKGLEPPQGTLLGLTFRIRNSAEIGSSTELTWSETRLYSETTEQIAHDVKHGIINIAALSVFPNPFTPNDDGWNDTANFIVPESVTGDVAVKIFGLAGNKIIQLSRVGATYMQWNGDDEQGHACKPGVYLYAILVDGKAISKGSITLMK